MYVVCVIDRQEWVFKGLWMEAATLFRPSFFGVRRQDAVGKFSVLLNFLRRLVR